MSSFGVRNGSGSTSRQEQEESLADRRPGGQPESPVTKMQPTLALSLG